MGSAENNGYSAQGISGIIRTSSSRRAGPRPNIEVRVGDLLMTCAGPRSRCGVVCLVERTRSKLMMSGKMYRFRPNVQAMDTRFLAYFIQSRGAQLAIDRMKTGISDSGLNLTHDNSPLWQFL